MSTHSIFIEYLIHARDFSICSLIGYSCSLLWWSLRVQKVRDKKVNQISILEFTLEEWNRLCKYKVIGEMYLFRMIWKVFSLRRCHLSWDLEYWTEATRHQEKVKVSFPHCYIVFHWHIIPQFIYSLPSLVRSFLFSLLEKYCYKHLGTSLLVYMCKNFSKAYTQK